MPSDSISLTRVPSLNRGGGSVKCCLGTIFFKVRVSPSARSGRVPSGASSSGSLSLGARFASSSARARKPRNRGTEPLARKVSFSAAMSTSVTSKTALAI